ncbi:MAG: hypothetical protein ACRDID_03935, partial [Ktedonobacterales bacterium]
QQGDQTGATRCFNELIAQAHTIGDYFHEARGLDCLADQALAVGDMAMARHAIEDGLTLARAHRVRLVYQWLYITRGKIALAECDWQEAEAWLRRGLAEAERFGAVSHIAACHASMARLAQTRGEFDAALDLLETARTQAALASETYMRAELDLALTELRITRGETELANVALGQATAKLRDRDYPLLCAQAERLRARLR